MLNRRVSDDAKFEVKAFLGSLTHRPGVYRMLDNKHRVIYVGKARDLKKRVASYFNRTQAATKTAAMMERMARVEVTVANTEAEALLLEYSLIKRHKPRFNVLLRDDKATPIFMPRQSTRFPGCNFIAVRAVARVGILGHTQALVPCARRSTNSRSSS